MCRLRVTTKTVEFASGVASMPLIRLHGVLSVSVADPDGPCKRKDLIGGIKKCIPEAAPDLSPFQVRAGA